MIPKIPGHSTSQVWHSCVLVWQWCHIHLDIAHTGRQRVACHRQPLAQRCNQRLYAVVARLCSAVHACTNSNVCDLQSTALYFMAPPQPLCKHSGRVQGQGTQRHVVCACITGNQHGSAGHAQRSSPSVRLCRCVLPGLAYPPTTGALCYSTSRAALQHVSALMFGNGYCLEQHFSSPREQNKSRAQSF